MALVVDNSKLLKRMKRYREVTGKSVASTLRRAARQMAVNLARDTQPYGFSSKKTGEQAVQNDILKLFHPLKGISNYAGKGLWGMAQRMNNRSLGAAIQNSIDGAIRKGKSARASHARAKSIEDLRAILQNAGRFSSFELLAQPDFSKHQAARNAAGRITKSGKFVMTDSKSLEQYIKDRQAYVGYSKAGWAAAALKVKADVSDALRGIPAWVKRHANLVPATVSDSSDGDKPVITLTNGIAWIDRLAQKSGNYSETKRIAQEKFYRSMNIEIRHALKKAASAA